MGDYKIPQNVEAEDKLIGPFTFRQFVFLLVAAAAAFTAWLLSRINGWLILVPLPVFLFFGFLGVYHREDQPVEIYLMAALNYYLKPRKRTWDPEGTKENLRLIAPPKLIAPKLKRLETEERGQLEKLAHVMDTRGWSTKRPELNAPSNRESIHIGDRLVSPGADAISQEPLDVHASDDLLDPINFPDAHKYRQLAESSTKEARQKAIAGMKQAATKIQETSSKRQEIEYQANKTTLTEGDPQNAVKYQPYPSVRQSKVDPETGVLQSKQRGIDTPQLPAAKPHLKLAQNQNLSVKHIAQQAKRLSEQNSNLSPGQEIDLHNRGEQPA